MATFLCTLVHGPAWDDARGIREQDGFDVHTEFMDALVADGFVIAHREDELIVRSVALSACLRAEVESEKRIERDELSVRSLGVGSPCAVSERRIERVS